MTRCSCAGNPRPAPGLVARLETRLRAIVAGVLEVAETLACAVAKVVLRDAIQAFIDGVAIECPECLPYILPFATALYVAALKELEKVCK